MKSALQIRNRPIPGRLKRRWMVLGEEPWAQSGGWDGFGWVAVPKGSLNVQGTRTRGTQHHYHQRLHVCNMCDRGWKQPPPPSSTAVWHNEESHLYFFPLFFLPLKGLLPHKALSHTWFFQFLLHKMQHNNKIKMGIRRTMSSTD